jgi:hypothetical protein
MAVHSAELSLRKQVSLRSVAFMGRQRWPPQTQHLTGTTSTALAVTPAVQLAAAGRA